MIGKLLNEFTKKHPDQQIVKSFDVGSEILVKAVFKNKSSGRMMDPYYFINKQTGSIRGAKIPGDLPTIEKAFTSGNAITIQNGE